MGIILNAENIYKSYGTVEVLKGASISVEEGEVVSIVGKSGSGKSTLLHTLSSLDDIDSGSVKVDGVEIHKLAAKELAKFRNTKIGFIFQFHHLLSEFTALENVCIPGYIQRKSKSVMTTKAKEILDYLGLGHRMDHKPTQLSGGEQQRVAVARALINDPKVIFGDEPSGNLDQETSDEMHQLIFKLRKDFGQTFILVTHTKELADMSDRCLVLQNGKLEPNE